MVSPGRQAEEFAVQHVGEASQRVPVGRFGAAERPLDTFPRKPSPDMVVLCDVIRVVEADEAVGESGQECSQDQHEYQRPCQERGAFLPGVIGRLCSYRAPLAHRPAHVGRILPLAVHPQPSKQPSEIMQP